MKLETKFIFEATMDDDLFADPRWDEPNRDVWYGIANTIVGSAEMEPLRHPEFARFNGIITQRGRLVLALADLGRSLVTVGTARLTMPGDRVGSCVLHRFRVDRTDGGIRFVWSATVSDIPGVADGDR